MPNREIVLNQENVKMTSPTTKKQRPSLSTSAMTRTQVHVRRYRTVTNGDHHQGFSLFICTTAHNSILEFPVFVYPLAYMFCSHYVRQVETLQALDGPSLVELST